MRGATTMVLVLMVACGGPESPVGADASADGPNEVEGGPADSGADRGMATTVDQIDLLLMVDNTVSRDAQIALSDQLGHLIEGLAAGQASNGQRFDAPSLQIGVITSDMGTGGFDIETCDQPDFGRDGLLSRETRDGELEGRPYLVFDGDAAPDRVQLAQSLINGIGVHGCGVEQPLEAVLKSLTPSGDDTVFVQNTRGHGDGANAGFLRPDSLLVVLVITDEDDCSLSNPGLFDASAELGELNLRCIQHGDPSEGYLHGIERYVEGLKVLHPPDRLVFHLVGAIPTDLIRSSGLADYTALNGSDKDPRLEERIQGMQLESSCGRAGHVGFPPRRLLLLAEALDQQGATSVVHSICDRPSTRGAPDVGLDSLLNELARHL